MIRIILFSLIVLVSAGWRYGVAPGTVYDSPITDTNAQMLVDSNTDILVQ